MNATTTSTPCGHEGHPFGCTSVTAQGGLRLTAREVREGR